MMHSEVITNVWLMGRMLFKVALDTGIGPAIALVIVLERYEFLSWGGVRRHFAKPMELTDAYRPSSSTKREAA